jgi:signal transduction histidine kinase
VLFRVVQEGLRNVRHHAEASQVTIRLSLEDEAVRLLVADDGRGIPGGAPRGRGRGLTSMRERVEAAGGRFEIRGDSGTRIEVVLPAEGVRAADA